MSVVMTTTASPQQVGLRLGWTFPLLVGYYCFALVSRSVFLISRPEELEECRLRFYTQEVPSLLLSCFLDCGGEISPPLDSLSLGFVAYASLLLVESLRSQNVGPSFLGWPSFAWRLPQWLLILFSINFACPLTSPMANNLVGRRAVCEGNFNFKVGCENRLALDLLLGRLLFHGSQCIYRTSYLRVSTERRR